MGAMGLVDRMRDERDRHGLLLERGLEVAEAAIGAGVTGAMLLDAVRQMGGAYLAIIAGAAPYLTSTPFSARYLAAPGCQGSGEASFFWFSSLKLAASLCTRIRSSRWSKIALTML